jgi:cystathionine gamma-lyase
MKESTRLIRATLAEARMGEPLHAGPVFAAPFHVAGDPAGAKYSYGRSHNPTWTELGAAIALLEGEGAAVRVFGSGMAAVAAVFGTVLGPGDTVVIPAGMYFGARNLLEQRFASMDVRIREVSAADLSNPATVAGARLVWIETPSNPELEITDIAAVANAAHAAGAWVAVDNTTATPWLQKPLELGADFSVCSDSKAMCGHSDLLLGHVATSTELISGIDKHRTLTGGIAGPMEAWLALRSLATLPLRLHRSCENALAIAEFLAGRCEVLYPGLKTHPGHAVAAAQMTQFGPVVGFTLASKKAAEVFLDRAELITQATSFGGISTSAERRGRWGHDAIAPGFIRLSAGCEDIDDLLADIEQAFTHSSHKAKAR